MKILNLFGGIGGNRTLWGDDHEITMVEMDPDIAAIYKKRFPNDIVIVGNAYDYLLEHYAEFDFIWGSPPCPSHSKMRYMPLTKKIYPDLKLYEMILFLQYWFKGKWVIENVVPYYKYLIKPNIILGRHPFWTNFYIQPKEFKIPAKFRKDIFNRKTPTKRGLKYTEFPNEYLCELHQVDWDLIKDVKFKDILGHDNKRKILRNCVLPELGKYILDQVGKKRKQTSLESF